MRPSSGLAGLVLVSGLTTVVAGAAMGATPAPEALVHQPVSRLSDTSSPTAPRNVDARLVLSHRVRVTWNAAEDNVGVTGYNVLRDGRRIASIGKRTTYKDTSAKLSRRYVYRVRAHDRADNVSDLSAGDAVQTLDPVIAAAGDIACDPATANFNGGRGTERWCRQMATSNLLVGHGYNRILTLGDNQYEEGRLATFRASYDPSWGRVKRITSPTVGNHEYRTKGAAGYYNYFGAAAGASGKGYYSYNLGNWHIIALNSECRRLADGNGVNGCANGSPENNWLEHDLATHSAKCTLAYWHRPPAFSNSNRGDSSRVVALWRDLRAAHADVVLNGHYHTYSRYTTLDASGQATSSGGTRLFIVGTGGKNHGEAPAVTPPSVQSRNDTTFGVLRMTLHPGGYSWRFVPEASSSFSDSGSASCH
jgi:Calcineurin-like phosphoesterase